jgi:uncharacterized membrane protein YgcG
MSKGLFATRAVACLLLVLSATLTLPSGTSAQAETRVAITYFHDELEPYGTWVNHPRYGWVWYPHHRPVGWSPYVYGRWVWTAEYGWYWDSEEEWGWAAYHYGRWVYTAAYGWVWVPDDEWGPAWVEWRTGGGYVGWCPMPPEVAWRGGTFVYSDVDMTLPHYHACWVFVAEARFNEPGPWRYRAPPKRNRALLKASVRATNYSVVNARLVNRSIDVHKISAAAKVQIRPLKVVTYDTHAGASANALGSGRIAIYRPRIGARAKVHTPPVSARVRGDIDADFPPPIDSHARGSIGAGARAGAGAGGGIGIGGGGGISIGGGGGIGIGR